MTRYRVDIRRKEGLADPEGAATKRALRDLGYGDVAEVAFGRVIYVDLADDDAQAFAQVEEMCARLLANPVIEDFTVEVAP